MSGATSPIARYYQGARPQDFTPAEALSLAEEIQHRHRDELTDIKHRFHQTRSHDVKALFERAAPGHLGAGGELVNGLPQVDTGSLFK